MACTDYSLLQEALKQITGQLPLSQGQTYLEILDMLDKAWKAKTKELDKELVHYLSKRSYVKALAWVTERVEEK